jgi:UDP:flavonoid glycosyltransferase YjiC (YdhE family)
MSENGARVAWSGSGLSLPRRLVSPRGVRVAARRIIGDERFRVRAEELARWARDNDGAATAAMLVEQAAHNATSRLSPARQ